MLGINSKSPPPKDSLQNWTFDNLCFRLVLLTQGDPRQLSGSDKIFKAIYKWEYTKERIVLV